MAFFKTIESENKMRPYWLACLASALLAAAAIFPAWIKRPAQNLDLDLGDEKIVYSLERTVFRFDFLDASEELRCPGQSCPLAPANNSEQLRFGRAPVANFLSLITEQGLNKTMYIRWDIQAPKIAEKVGDLVAFDFYGLVGDRYRFFVNGIEVSSGDGRQSLAPIVFASPVAAGERLTFGFEISAGRHLTPGLVNIAQPFLSRPSIAAKLRSYYRAKDEITLLPLATTNTLIAMLAAIGAIFTPFYRELIAFSLLVTSLNVRRLLLNGVVDYNSFFGLDAVVLDSIARALAFSMLWAFWRLYFRSKSKLALVPVFTYLALIPLFLASVLSNELAKITIGFAKYTDIHFALAFIAGIGFSFVSFRESKRHHWTAFRKNVCLFYAIASAVLAVTFVVRFLILSGNLEQSTLIHFAGFLEFARLALVGFTILSGVTIFMEWAIIVRDRQVVLKKFGRMVDPRLMNEIIRGPEQRSERLERVTVMVVDLRAFTELCEKYDPEIVMEALNQYLSLVTAIVRSHGGVVDKFVGDSVVAYWGAPSRGENDEISAVRAAVDVRVSLVALNRERIRKQSFPLSVGIGLHCGAAIFGPVGAIDRVDYTVIGGAINIASRLQSLTKAHDFDILVSDNLYQLTTASAFVEEIGPVKIRGIEQMISIHKLIGVDMGERGFVIGSQSLESSYLGRSPGKLAKPQSILPLARPADFSAITDEDDEQAA